MLSMKNNREMDIYRRQYKSQEFARELNKREQRRLDQEVGGRGGIEAEYRFNLDKVNQERKEIERELNKIRGGVHKQLTHHATLSSDKKFHHPKFKDFGMKDTSGRSPRLQRKALPESNSREKDPSPMDAEMLIEYLQSFNKAHAQDNNGISDGIKGSGRFIQNKYNDLPHVQINPLIISDQSETIEAENSNDSEEQKQYIQTLSDSQSQGTLSVDHTDTKETSLERQQKNESGETTSGMSSPRHSPVRRLSVDKGKHIAPGTSPPRHFSARRLSTDKGKNTSPVFNDDVHGPQRHNPTRRLSTDKGKYATPPGNEDIHAHPRRSPTRRPSADKGKHITPPGNEDSHGHVRHSPTRRPSADKGKHTTLPGNEDSHAHVRHSPTRRLSTDTGTHPSPLHVADERPNSPPCTQSENVNETEIASVWKEADVEKVETQPKVPAEEEEKTKPNKLVIGPESFNPDGSLKTMYTVPPFEQSWEEARKARYIRTREPLERDRQLTTNEIFDKSS
ncbi:uncharacterized protein LOC133179386 [Saccostrea echinata]|uniref:uncharacterized protein LOC133179386 n=1 Tax=Saccostrea echinata TaxID=191078 RepID=UPI002A813DBA|nr:uncharacterized protein LOC133179386 [Saccostrea echinata]